MDGEKRKVANGSSSADGDALSDGINLLEKPRHVQYFDVGDDEELATPKETDGSEDTIKALDEEIQGLRRDCSEMQRRMEEMLEKKERSEADRRSLAARATELEGELARSQENLNLISSKADSLRFTVKTLESDKTILEDRIRDLEARMSDLESENSKAAQHEKMSLNLKEELRLARDNGKEQLEMEKKKTAIALDEKEREVVSLKQELLLARDKGIEELEAKNREVVGDKEAEIFLVKKLLYQTLVDTRLRAENLESEMKLLKDMNSELEGKIKEIQFKFDSDMTVQSSRGIDLIDGESKAKCSKVSWITTAAVAASSGTVAAAVTAFCLHRNKQS